MFTEKPEKIDVLQHVTNHVDLQIVRQRMRSAGLTIIPGKVQPAEEKMNLLRFVVDKGILATQPREEQALLHYPPPDDAKSLEMFSA